MKYISHKYINIFLNCVLNCILCYYFSQVVTILLYSISKNSNLLNTFLME